MGKFTQIPVGTVDKLQLNAGVICTSFSTTTGVVDGVLGATSGGVSFTATPSFYDLGEDIDNCPKNTKELKRLEQWEVKMSGTFVSVDTVTASLLALSNAVDTKITGSNEIVTEDFNNLWWVGDYTSGEGEFIAIEMKNALSTGGFSLQTTDKNKGQFAFEFTAHTSLNDDGENAPFNIYIGKPSVV